MCDVKYEDLPVIYESIRNYVSSHLVLTQNGLFLQADNNPYRLDITPTVIYDGQCQEISPESWEEIVQMAEGCDSND